MGAATRKGLKVTGDLAQGHRAKTLTDTELQGAWPPAHLVVLCVCECELCVCLCVSVHICELGHLCSCVCV